MKKFISFSVFAMIVILSLVIRNSVEAQVVVRQRAVVVAPRVVVARQIFPGPGYVWRDNGWTIRRHYRPHVAYGVGMHARPVVRHRRYY